MRFTVPLVTTPDPGSTTGLGDISFFDLFVAATLDWGIWDAGKLGLVALSQRG